MSGFHSNPVQEQINAYWNWRSATYDHQPGHGVHMSAAERSAWISTLKRLLPAPPSVVLDVGTGTGFLAFLAAELGHIVTGIDLAEGMLAQAQAMVSTIDHSPVFQLGDAVAPDFPPASFDVVMSRHVLWTLRDPSRAFRNWLRLLKPGGRVVAIDSFWFDPEQPQEIDDENVRKQWMQYYSPQIQEALPHFALNNHAPLVEDMKAAGFQNISVELLTEIREAEATPIGRHPRYALIGYCA